MSLKRIFVEKKKNFNVEAQSLYQDLKTNLGIEELESVRIANRYDIEGLSDGEFARARDLIFHDPPVDHIYEEHLPVEPGEKIFALEYLTGQYDQRADLAEQCVQFITCKERPIIHVAKVIVLSGEISKEQLQKIKEYLINPIESREASLDKPDSLVDIYDTPNDVENVEGFITMDQDELESFWRDMGFAMTLDDLKFCREYFEREERRDPTVTELKVIDTYWSDHCRHTTFLTGIKSVEFEKGAYTDILSSSYEMYKKARSFVYTDNPKQECLMDIATIAMKKMKKQGLLDDLDESDEINACSIVVDVDVDGEQQEWLVMFKNETHNHPTEMEPFGGAATCLGGAIRDPLSGRAYVYQAMRITGSGDPRTPFADTIPGKLPQRRITTEAAAGYSSYGNQIGVAAGQVDEIYHPGYVAKRMELGAVIAAAPKENVVRSKPLPGDVIVLLGGRTGRDGCGGATGSSKAHTEDSLMSCGAEVQKGNPHIEHKIQSLFRKPVVTRMIKKCNDFGAGGVSVAIGELADGLNINLDAVPTKYEGLDGTELAIAESQERMAVVLAPENAKPFIQAAHKEGLEATIVAEVTDSNRLRMVWRGKSIVDISRDFLDTNGVEQYTDVYVPSPSQETSYFNVSDNCELSGGQGQKKISLKERWLSNLQSLNICSQRGLTEQFDSTIGAGTVLMPLGGKYQLTPAEGMAAKIPLLRGDTNTATLMTYGFNPDISSWSPFHGALYAVIEAVAKITAMGGDYRKVRLTLQEYFERLGTDPQKWGKPFSALLGALYAQEKLGIPAIGGKDSMSGTFEDLTVPPTLVAFAVCTADARYILSPEFKLPNSKVVLIPLNIDGQQMPDFEQLERNYTLIHRLALQGKIRAAHSIRRGGMAEAISKMCFGNRIGFKFEPIIEEGELFQPLYGSILLEISADEDPKALLEGIDYTLIGSTQKKAIISVNNEEILLVEAQRLWESPLETVFPVYGEDQESRPNLYTYEKRSSYKPSVSYPTPRVLIPVFPGTNGEYDSARAFETAGGKADIMVIRNLTPQEVHESLSELAQRIEKAQIVMLPGGDGSSRFITAAFRNPKVKDALMDLLKHRDGLILGISDGFQALIRLGLVPFGEIRDMDVESPALTINTTGKHVSRMVQTRVSSIMSPWLSHAEVGDVYTIPLSHGEGRFIADNQLLKAMAEKGQIATQYVDAAGSPAGDSIYNPNGSMDAIEGITSPDGRVFGKMGHSERVGAHAAKNIPGDKDQKIFLSGVEHFK
jgi:phosphoribosylformylglycinamidine synthase